MARGKEAAQLGHGFLSVITAHLDRPETQVYLQDHPGTKVCLIAPTLRDMIKAWVDAHLHGIPAFLVMDSDCQNFYGGRPIVTALGIGPCPTAPFLKHFRLQP